MKKTAVFNLLLLFLLILRRTRLQRNQRRRTLWVRGVFLKGKSQGEFGNLVRELRTYVRQRALLSICCQFCILVFKVIASVLQTCSTSQMHEIKYNTHPYIVF